jgi:phosphomannomutase
MDFKPKLVVFDLDGTLAESKQRLTVEMGELLSELLEKMPVAVMSGASFAQFEKQFLPVLPSDAKLENLYLFPTNAAQCYRHDHTGWVLVYDESFTKLERERILHALGEALHETGLEEPPQTWGERIEDRGAQIAFSGLGQQAPVEEKRKWDPERKQRLLLREALLKKIPDFSISIGGMTTVDITRKGITKAHGIRELASLTGISISEMLYVGDALGEGGNDSVVIPTGVQTKAVFGPEETAKIIQDFLR